MNVELLFTGRSATPRMVRGKNALVVDVLRATSVIVTAIENGASAVVPFGTVGEARRYAADAERRPLLGGERGAVRIDGFDCGNSPLEYTRERVAGREVVLTTTNGTRALENARGADRLLVLCMRNAGAAAGAIAAAGRDAVIVCAGTDGKFSADDALCAGIFLDRLCARTDARLDDAGRFVRDFCRMGLAGRAGPRDLLRESLHVNRLRARGFEADLDYCLTVDATDVVPACREGRITA